MTLFGLRVRRGSLLVIKGTGDRGLGTGSKLGRHLSSLTVYGSGMRYFAVLILALTALIPSRGASQESAPKTEQKGAPVPKAYLPPAGMCRVWVDNVPAARQPAPTDCATAIRNRPPNARVVFPAGKSAEPKSLAPGRAKGDTTKKKPPKN